MPGKDYYRDFTPVEEGRPCPPGKELGDTIRGAWVHAVSAVVDRMESKETSMRIFGREPAVLMTLIAAALQLANTFWFHWSDDQTAAINAAIAILLGAVAAALTAVDQLLPLLAGIAQALITVAVAFGFDWSQDKVTAVMAIVAAFVAFFGVRPAVTAVVAPDGSSVPRQPLYGNAG
jgi:hypothetical protein